MIRAFFHADQHLHDPRQFMRLGKVRPPKDTPARLDALQRSLDRQGIAAEKPNDYGLAPALTVHSKPYLDFLATAYERWRALPDAGLEVWPNTFPYWNGQPDLDVRPPCPSSSVVAQAGYYLGDLAVPLGPRSWASCLAATHVAAAAADAVLAGTPAAYALCRPSGHHARADRASGFCYVNNAAVAAHRLRGKFARVAVLDVDAHHGDGTQAIFYRRADVFTVSVHADPTIYYPFYTGYTHETGHGAGAGANLNIPLAPGDGDDRMHAAVDRAAAAIRDFGADALVVPLGFDSHRDDPIGVLKVTTAGYEGIGARVRALGLPTVVVQEGGYQVSVLGDCLANFFTGLGR